MNREVTPQECQGRSTSEVDARVTRRNWASVTGAWACAVFVASLAAQTRHLTTVDTGTANLPAQTIGVNDLIVVSVYDAPELTRTVRVSADGWIRLPMVKEQIRAKGLLPAELEVSIVSALEKDHILVEPFVTVTVAEYLSRPIRVAGAVKDPTSFQAVGAVTLLEAITRAGGLTADAGPEILVSSFQPGPDGVRVMITRRVFTRALTDAADSAANLKLVGGEEIRVPLAGKIYVVGNVKKPGAYPIRDSAESTVLKMLAHAEGLAPYAAKQAFVIRRDSSTGTRSEIPIELKKILQRKSPDISLVAEDMLYIPDATGRRAGLAALQQIMLFGTGATTALIYGVAVR